MSEISNHKKERTEKLLDLFLKVIREELTAQTAFNYEDVIKNTEPADVIAVVDELVKMQVAIPELKKGINKTLNLLSKTLQNFPYTPPARGSFFDWLIRNNEQIDLRLKAIRPLLKELNQNPEDTDVRSELKNRLADLQKIDMHYQIKENVFFPLVESVLPGYRCLQVMWSFHDDIRRNLKEMIHLLEVQIVDLPRFNRLSGDLFFNIYAIKFREERILFPVISAIVSEEKLNSLLPESFEIGFPFVQPELSGEKTSVTVSEISGEVDLKTGSITPEQIRLIFNHLPVDITYVDENNKVKFFSTPEKRIFRRTNSIIGRDVKNCHPHESVHVVEQIVEAFRNGEKDRASFWIRMKGEMILIQYFAVRDENGRYKGVVEVTQEISEIQTLEGERRLLEWEK
ncbi:MAG TPA: PAS domain-containing protein [Prolixibacteraceae bacterium]|nr:PAS domain-containing protein [Prolixibacteraceae bacterium]HPR84810.1 PAS domain-containing protein [Prolixibacteraceae bacterium]